MSSPALAGLRVLDLTRYIPGPYCTMLLGDLGADVVKVEEPPMGDPTRFVPPAVGEDTAAHAALNRNKRSVVVDIRREEGADLVRRLAAAADVLVEAFRPGALERRGLGADALLAQNPRLVYCSVSGYGPAGDLAARAGHDIDYAALGGLLGVNRDREGRAVLPGTQVADVTGGLLAALGILAALHARERTGRGQHVHASLLHGVLAQVTLPLTRRLAGGRPPDELAGAYACYRIYRCRDGRELAVGALEPKFWEALCRAMGLEPFVGRQWDRGERRAEVHRAFEEAFAAADRADWLERLRPADACVEPVLDLEEVARSPFADALLAEQPSGGTSLRTVRSPLGLTATPPGTRREAPPLGAHTDEVLGEAGLGRAEIERLRDTGVIA